MESNTGGTNSGFNSPHRIEPMSFDKVYSDRHAGYDTHSQIDFGNHRSDVQQGYRSIQPSSNNGYSPLRSNPMDQVCSDRYTSTNSHTGNDFQQRGNSPLVGAGSCISIRRANEETPYVPYNPSQNRYAGNATRSQITFENFGGVADNGHSKSSGRYAGHGTKSSITVANFGGDSNLQPNHNQIYQQPITHRQQSMTYQERSPVLSRVNPEVPLENALSFIAPSQADKMIREIAELRVKNLELEEQVMMLNQQLHFRQN